MSWSSNPALIMAPQFWLEHLLFCAMLDLVHFLGLFPFFLRQTKARPDGHWNHPEQTQNAQCNNGPYHIHTPGSILSLSSSSQSGAGRWEAEFATYCNLITFWELIQLHWLYQVFPQRWLSSHHWFCFDYYDLSWKCLRHVVDMVTRNQNATD